MNGKTKFALLIASFPLFPSTLLAQEKGVTQTEETVTESAAFINSHPDLRHRTRGMDYLSRGNARKAFEQFQRAAYYADKPSQAMIASMYWEGKGVEQNRALAYAWMDLAAERYYPDFLAQREQYWAQLSETEQQQAITVGAEVYARYGDEAALPRIERILRRERLAGTGSRTGFAGKLTVHLPVAGAGSPTASDGVASVADHVDSSMRVDGSHYYSQKFWNPREYRTWQDAQWGVERTGQVHVGDLKTRPAAAEKAKEQAENKDCNDC